MANIWNIPTNISFFEALYQFLHNEITPAFDLKKACVFLPNQRSCDGFQDFLTTHHYVSPHIFSLGDLNTHIFKTLHIPVLQNQKKVISSLERQLYLTQLIANYPCIKSRDAQNHESWVKPSIDFAFKFASSLGDLLDELYIADQDIGQLDILIGNLPLHLKNNIQFLKIISEFWPKICQDLQVIDKITHHQNIVSHLCQCWTQTPPDYPVILAGSHASQIYTRKLAGQIAQQPQGHIVLSNLDRSLSPESWQDLPRHHAQYHYSKLLQALNSNRNNVVDIAAKDDFLFQAKSDFLSQAFQPADHLYLWSGWLHKIHQNPMHKKYLQDSLSSLSAYEVKNLHEESQLIFEKIKNAQEANKSICIISNNIDLNHFVQIYLDKENIDYVDPKAKKVLDHPYGQFFQFICQLSQNAFEASWLLALLKHPLIQLTCFDRDKQQQLTAELEIKFLRGPKQRPGLKNLKKQTKDHPDLLTLILEIEQIFHPLEELLTRYENRFEDLFKAHIGIFHNLTEHLPHDEAMISLHQDLETLESQTDYHNYMFTFDQYTKFVTSYLQHCRILATQFHNRQTNVYFLPPMEARLLSFDCVILAEINEKTWPQSQNTDLWLNRYAKKILSLDWSERQIGLSQHDFWFHLMQKEVVLTRAIKIEGQSVQASRWWIRLMSLLSSVGLKESVVKHFALNQQQTKNTDLQTCERPSPKPPLSARPKKLSVTKVEMLMRDPYSYYAEKILKLIPLPKLGEEPQHFDYGRLIHKIFEDFSSQYPQHLPEAPQEKLIDIGKKHFSQWSLHPEIMVFWWPKFLQTADWFIQKEQQRDEDVVWRHCEVSGEMEIEQGALKIKITAQADRIDQKKNNQIEIIDFKTGALPSAKEVYGGYAPQLPLEGLILQKEGFAHTFEDMTITEILLSYWRLKSYNQEGEIRTIPFGSEQQADTWERTCRLLTYYFNEENGYLSHPNPEIAPKYSPYDHLSRIDEWKKNAA